mgnify:CR=1 FL=1
MLKSGVLHSHVARAEPKFPVQRKRHAFGMAAGMAPLNRIFQSVLNMLHDAPAKKVASQTLEIKKPIPHGTRHVGQWMYC